MDNLNLLRKLDRCATYLRSLGLGRLTRTARQVLKKLLPEEFTVEVDGLQIAGGLEHRGYLWSIRAGTRESFMLKLFDQALRPGMVVVDLGAFLGWYSLHAARRVGPPGVVYAFEPDRRSFPFLCRNIERNGFQSIIRTWRVAVLDRGCQVPLFLHDSDPSQTSIYHQQGTQSAEVAEAITLDQLLPNDVSVDVIKIDVEGSELQALKGMTGVIARGAKDLTVFVECNPSALHSAGSSGKELLGVLRGLGFSIQVIDELQHRLAEIPADIDAVKYVNLWCRRI